MKVVAKSRRLLYLLTREQAAGFETDVSALGDLVRLQQGDHDRQVAQDQELLSGLGLLTMCLRASWSLLSCI